MGTRRRGRGWTAGGVLLASLLLAGPMVVARPAHAESAARWGGLVPPSATLFGVSGAPAAAPAGRGSATVAVAGLEESIGRKLDIDQHRYAWDERFPTGAERSDADQGRIPMIIWDGARLDDIIGGSQDELIAARAEAVRDLGGPVFLSWGAGMNDGTAPWSGLRNNDPGRTNGPAKFVAAWRHIHHVFASAGATNAVWVWTPDSQGDPEAPWNHWSAYYPGDAHVDWVGISGYNWGTARAPYRWTPFASIVDDIYAAYAARKPVMVHTGSVSKGGDLAAWIRDAQASIQTRFPAVAGLVYSELSPTSGDAATALRQLALDPHFDLLSAGQNPGSAYPWTDVTELGARGDGVTDDTAALQRSLDGGRRIVFVPAGDYLVSRQLRVASETTLWFAPGSTLMARTQDWQGDSLLSLNGVHDVTVVGGILDGRKQQNPRGYLYGLSIEGGPNARIRVQGTVSRNMPARDESGGNGGDGFYLGSGTDVRFDSVVADGNVRQGLSITGSVRNVLIVDSEFKNTSGTNPGAGLDIEPNPGYYVLTGIRIIRSTFAANNWGLVATLANDPRGRLSDFHVEDSVMRGNRRDGMVLTSNGSLIDGVELMRNLVEGNGANGMYIVDRVRAALRHNIIRDNTAHGLMLEGNRAETSIRYNRLARNDRYGAYILDSDDFRVQGNRIFLNGRDGIRMEYPQRGRTSGVLGENRFWNNGASSGEEFDGLHLTTWSAAECECLVVGNVFGNDDRGPMTQRGGVTLDRDLDGVLFRDNDFRRNLRFHVQEQ